MTTVVSVRFGRWVVTNANDQAVRRSPRRAATRTPVHDADGDISWHAFARELDGLSYEALRKVLAGQRSVTQHVIEEVARVLELEPATSSNGVRLRRPVTPTSTRSGSSRCSPTSSAGQARPHRLAANGAAPDTVTEGRGRRAGRVVADGLEKATHRDERQVEEVEPAVEQHHGEKDRQRLRGSKSADQ